MQYDRPKHFLRNSVATQRQILGCLWKIGTGFSGEGCDFSLSSTTPLTKGLLFGFNAIFKTANRGCVQFDCGLDYKPSHDWHFGLRHMSTNIVEHQLSILTFNSLFKVSKDTKVVSEVVHKASSGETKTALALWHRFSPLLTGKIRVSPAISKHCR